MQLSKLFSAVSSPAVRSASDSARLQNYLGARFGNKRLSLKRRENKYDSADLMLEDEFIGVVFQDDEESDVYCHVQITILEEDLDEVEQEVVECIPLGEFGHPVPQRDKRQITWSPCATDVGRVPQRQLKGLVNFHSTA